MSVHSGHGATLESSWSCWMRWIKDEPTRVSAADSEISLNFSSPPGAFELERGQQPTGCASLFIMIVCLVLAGVAFTTPFEEKQVCWLYRFHLMDLLFSLFINVSIWGKAHDNDSIEPISLKHEHPKRSNLFGHWRCFTQTSRIYCYASLLICKAEVRFTVSPRVYFFLSYEFRRTR